MSNTNYSNVLSDPEIPDTITKEQALMLLDGVIKETFFELFERAFGEPDTSVREKVELANMVEVKEWMTNIVGAKVPDDVFVKPILCDVVKFAAGVLNRKYGSDIDISKINKPEDLYAHLNEKGDEP